VTFQFDPATWRDLSVQHLRVVFQRARSSTSKCRTVKNNRFPLTCDQPEFAEAVLPAALHVYRDIPVVPTFQGFEQESSQKGVPRHEHQEAGAAAEHRRRAATSAVLLHLEQSEASEIERKGVGDWGVRRRHKNEIVKGGIRLRLGQDVRPRNLELPKIDAVII
jgi:hypothetical protein